MSQALASHISRHLDRDVTHIEPNYFDDNIVTLHCRSETLPLTGVQNSDGTITIYDGDEIVAVIPCFNQGDHHATLQRP